MYPIIFRRLISHSSRDNNFMFWSRIRYGKYIPFRDMPSWYGYFFILRNSKPKRFDNWNYEE